MIGIIFIILCAGLLMKAHGGGLLRLVVEGVPDAGREIVRRAGRQAFSRARQNSGIILCHFDSGFPAYCILYTIYFLMSSAQRDGLDSIPQV